jgi:hypothetical protein
VYFDEPFDPGSLDNWTVLKSNAGDTIAIVSDPDEPGNSLLYINKTSSGTTGNALGIYNTTDANAYGIFTIETRIKRAVSNSDANQLHIYTYDKANSFSNGNGANSAVNFILNQGQMWSHNNSSTATALNSPAAYTANTWYKVVIRIDTTTKKFSIYVNGTLKANEWTFRTSVNEIDIFNIAAGNSGTAPGEMWVDYIKVYQGEPQF